jgi:hypothetical protein
MKRVLAATAIAGFLSLGMAAPAFAATPAGQSPGNPSGTGQPSQTCLSSTAPNEPGNAASSPGSPFHEPGATGPTDPGGIGGQNYNPGSQYDVACYHQPAK